MDDQSDQIADERRREAYRNAASNLLAFGHETDQPAHRVQSPTSGAWHPCRCSRGKDHVGELRQPAIHVPPPGADWAAHAVEPDGFCEAHMDAASRGEVPYGGHIKAMKLPDVAPGDPVSTALAILAARGVKLPDDPVLLVVPEGWFDLSDDPTLIPWPPKPDDRPF